MPYKDFFDSVSDLEEDLFECRFMNKTEGNYTNFCLRLQSQTTTGVFRYYDIVFLKDRENDACDGNISEYCFRQ